MKFLYGNHLKTKALERLRPNTLRSIVRQGSALRSDRWRGAQTTRGPDRRLRCVRLLKAVVGKGQRLVMGDEIEPMPEVDGRQGWCLTDEGSRTDSEAMHFLIVDGGTGQSAAIRKELALDSLTTAL